MKVKRQLLLDSLYHLCGGKCDFKMIGDFLCSFLKNSTCYRIFVPFYETVGHKHYGTPNIVHEAKKLRYDVSVRKRN